MSSAEIFTQSALAVKSICLFWIILLYRVRRENGIEQWNKFQYFYCLLKTYNLLKRVALIEIDLL